MGMQGTSRAKISIEDVVLDETGEIHITGEKDEYLLPPDVGKEDFEKVIIEDFKGEEMSLIVDNTLLSRIESQKIDERGSDIAEYLQKFISVALFILAVLLAVWVNDKLKDVIGIVGTLLAGFIILSASVLSIFFLGLFSSRLQSNHN